MTLAAELELANANTGPALLKASTVTLVGLELDEFQRLGIGAVTIGVAYPVLGPSFPKQQRYLAFYRQVARIVHARRMTLAVDMADLLSGTPFSAIHWTYRDPTAASYAAAKARMARLVISVMHPRYLTLEGEPDTETVLTGLPLTDPATYANIVAAEVKRIGRHPGTLIGAGPGSWSSPIYDRALARISGLDYLDTQVLPTDPEAIANITTAARIAHAAGKEVVMDSASLYKASGPSPLAVARATNLLAHEFNYDSFFAPLDQQFLRKLVALTRADHFAYVSASNSFNFATYLQYTPTMAANSYWQLTRRYDATVGPALAEHRITGTGRTYAALLG